MYVGLACLIVGIVTLIGIFVAVSNRPSVVPGYLSAELRFNNGIPLPDHRIERQYPGGRRFPAKDRGNGHGSPKHGSKGRISPRVNGLYVSNIYSQAGFQGKAIADSPDSQRIPVEHIVRKAGWGASNLEIAYDLGIGRDEVTMVLNLNRLARESAA